MQRVRLLSGIAFALVYIISNWAQNNLEIKGVVYSIVTILCYFAALFPAIYRACILRKHRVFMAALVAGIDTGAIVGLLVFAYRVLTHLKILPGYTAYPIILYTAEIIVMFIMCLVFSTLLGLVFFLWKLWSRKTTAGETGPEQSLFYWRRPVSYIPIGLWLLILIAGIPIMKYVDGSLQTVSLREYQERMQHLRDMQPQIGDPAPDVQMETLDGQIWRLANQRGKVVLLDFWATWCGPCLEFLPTLQRVHQEIGPNDAFLLVTVSLDYERSALKNYIKTNDMPWTILYKDIGYDGWEENEFAKEFGVYGIPSVWIIDKNGTIVAKELRDEEQLKQKLSLILGQPYVDSHFSP